jgi:four helix bundle protein
MERGKRERRTKYDLEERLVNFAVRIIDIVEKLPRSYTGSHIANQLVRSGTSPAANYGEA